MIRHRRRSLGNLMASVPTVPVLWSAVLPVLLIAILPLVLVLIATRRDPLLSPDSVTYLAAAQNVHRHLALTDFTGQPMTVFGPVYPLLLSIGGASLFWATLIGASAYALASVLLYRVLARRIGVRWGLPVALAFGSSAALVRVSATVWSEMPYIACSLATLWVLVRAPRTRWGVVAAGVLAGIGFLIRYAGVGLIITGIVVLLLAHESDRAGRRRTSDPLLFVGVAGATSAMWVVRNLVRTGEALGPRFEGGSREALTALLRRPLPAIGELIVGDHVAGATRETVGAIAIGALALAALLVLCRPAGRARPDDVGMAVFGLTSLVVPVVARAATSNDIEFRVMSPTLVAVVYFAALGAKQLLRARALVVVGLLVAGWWAMVGVSAASALPDRLPASAASRTQFSPALYDAIGALPADAQVLTNSPQRVWWQTRREPILFAFTRPRAGNSHYPLSVEATLRKVCATPTYLAWFSGLQNAGRGPQERRPDLTAVVRLEPVQTMTGGTLYRLSALDPTACRT